MFIRMVRRLSMLLALSATLLCGQSKLQLHFIDVGQGDGAILISPGGEVAGRLTFDINATLKYLRDAEVVGHEKTDGTLDLRHVKGWRFYDEASVSVALDRGKHANFVVTWKRGAKAPNWTNTNTVITGFAFAY